MTNTTGSTPEAMVLLHNQLRARGLQPELLLKAIGMLDGDIDALHAMLAPILTGTALLLENKSANLTHSQLETLSAMQDAGQEFVARLGDAKALTTSLHGYWRQTDDRREQSPEQNPYPGWEPARQSLQATGRRTARLADYANRPNPDEMPAFLTAQETAAYLDLPLVVVHSISSLRPLRVNDRYLYRTADVERFSVEMGATVEGEVEPAV